MTNKTAFKQFKEFEDALRNMFLTICYELKFDLIIEWLDEKIKMFRT